MIPTGAIRRTRVIAALAVVSLGVGAATSSATRAPAEKASSTAISPAQAANESAARSDAESLLAQLALPPGATPSPSEPAEDDALLSRPGIGPLATPNVVDTHAWWLVPGPPSTALAYVREHLPAGVTTVVRSDGLTGPGRPPNEAEAFAWPPLANVLSTRWLAVNVVALPSGSTGLRVDAEVVWVTPRPASETIPSGAHLLRLSVIHTLEPRRRAPRSLVFTSTSRIDRVVTLLNELPVAQPGIESCPSDAGNRVRLAFYDRRGSAPSAIADVNPEGCSTVQLTLAGVSQPPLAGGALPGSPLPPPAPLLTQLQRILGVKLDVERRPEATPARPSRRTA